MTNILIIYHSIKGNVKMVADEIAIGAKSLNNTNVKIKSVQEVTPEDILSADGIAFGCLKFYGSLSPEMSMLFEKLYPLRERLKYKVGTAFSGSPSQYGGQEQVMETLVYAMLNPLFMIVVGEDIRESGFIGGYIASEVMDEKAQRANRALGKRLAIVASMIKNTNFKLN
jgi:NAD(P)H dehydrogenase (quinone)